MEISVSKVAVLLKKPLRSNRSRSTSFYSFPEILSRLERALQDLSRDIRFTDRSPDLIDRRLPEVGLFFDFSLAYPSRPPKEIVAYRHYSPARLTVTDCFSQWLVSCLPFLFSESLGICLRWNFVGKVVTDFLGVFFLLEFKSGWKGIDLLCIRVISVDCCSGLVNEGSGVLILIRS